ncbi:MAG: hypothetical protein HIU92_02615 [Proteobacteria bacterium]|nr:hypothetical protein [Pseudomonadota bacterium]
MTQISDSTLSRALDDLRDRYSQDGDVIAAWDAIERLTKHNRKQAERGLTPYPMPDWMNSYLAQCAEKIGRLSLGIDPADERPLPSIPFDEVGALRQVPDAEGGYTDKRSSYVGQALGFVRKGWSAFQRHDRETSDDLHLSIHDSPQLEDHRQLRKEVQGSLSDLIQKQESISALAFRNRLSKARQSPRRSKTITKPAPRSRD